MRESEILRDSERGAMPAHRTGLALNVFLGSSDGAASVSSDDQNRNLLSRSAAYRWLAANADRFGFAPNPFEPWHREYILPLPGRSQSSSYE